MSEKPRRRFWQIHLSTALIAVLFVGFLFYLNTIPHTAPYGNEFASYSEDQDGQKFEIWGKVHEFGWPLRAYQQFFRTVTYKAGKLVEGVELKTSFFDTWREQVQWLGVLIDSSVAIALTGAVMLCCERFSVRALPARGREVRRP